MKINNLAVIVTTEHDKVYQVMLTPEMAQQILNNIVDIHFKGTSLKLHETELETLSIVNKLNNLN